MHAPEIFDQRDEDGVVLLLDENPPAEQAESARKAAAGCPVAAIHIEESSRSLTFRSIRWAGEAAARSPRRRR
jgi:hypothetical protein